MKRSRNQGRIWAALWARIARLPEGPRAAQDRSAAGLTTVTATPARTIAAEEAGLDVCRLTPYNRRVIKSFRHRGLKALYEGRGAAKVAPGHAAKLERILTTLDRCSGPEGMNLPGYRLHRLKGPLKGYYAVSVSGNWRVTFRFEAGDAVEVDYLDYH